MARLSVNDLNNLSGISEKELEDLYKDYRKAHTKVFNDMDRWIQLFDSRSKDLKQHEGKSLDDDLLIYKVARKMYYDATLILDNVDMLSDNACEHQGIMTKLRMNPQDIRQLDSLMKNKKKEIINRLSDCYGIYSEAYKRLEEEYEQ